MDNVDGLSFGPIEPKGEVRLPSGREVYPVSEWEPYTPVVVDQVAS